MPKLSYVGVERLLGRFKHEVNFDADWEFVILHGPNGVGKTRLLELIHSVLSGQLERLKRIPFDSAELRYDDGSSIAVGHRGLERLPAGDIEDAKQTTIEVRLTRPGQAPVAFEVEPMGDIAPGRMAALERELNAQRVGPDEWMDMSFGDRVTTHGLIERYADEFPRGFFGRPSEQPSEFRDFIAETPVHLIETQRLLMARPWRTRRGVAAEHVPITVMRHARELTERLSRALADNSTISQRLDRTFPGRVIVDAPAPNVTEEQIRQRYSEQGLLRDRLETVSLLDEAASDVRLPERELKDWERGVLWTYLEDAEEKLSTFLPLLERVQLLREIVNARFLFKELVIDREHGFRFLTENGDEIGPSELSSGEQHELVLAYDLLFNVEESALVLVDEPEISLHISWQRQFLTDLARIAELQSLRFVIATHSPQVIHKWWDRAVTLYGDPSDDTE
jgi:energy-coupling factor transporter ATP-binding protein EcfA2